MSLKEPAKDGAVKREDSPRTKSGKLASERCGEDAPGNNIKN